MISEYNLSILNEKDEIAELAFCYRENGILPKSSILDSMHVACATFYEMDLVISLNFRHIVRTKTLELLHLYNAVNNLAKPKINAPMEVIDYDNEI